MFDALDSARIKGREVVRFNNWLDCWFARTSLVLNIAHRFYTYLNSILELGADVPLERTKGELPKQIGCLPLFISFLFYC